MVDLDVKQAFDYMGHIALDDTNKQKGISTNARLAALRDYIDKKGEAKINGMETTEQFDYDSGGMQGGVRTPDEFNDLIKQIFSTMVEEWRTKGLGFKLWNDGFYTEGTYTLVNLITFADNFTIFAATYEELQTMLDDITERLTKVGMTWKVQNIRKEITWGRTPCRLDY